MPSSGREAVFAQVAGAGALMLPPAAVEAPAPPPERMPVSPVFKRRMNERLLEKWGPVIALMHPAKARQPERAVPVAPPTRPSQSPAPAKAKAKPPWEKSRASCRETRAASGAEANNDRGGRPGPPVSSRRAPTRATPALGRSSRKRRRPEQDSRWGSGYQDGSRHEHSARASSATGLDRPIAPVHETTFRQRHARSRTEGKKGRRSRGPRQLQDKRRRYEGDVEDYANDRNRGRSLIAQDGFWKRTLHASTAGRKFGKCRHEKPSPYAHSLCATCFATSGVITAYTA